MQLMVQTPGTLNVVHDVSSALSAVFPAEHNSIWDSL